MQLLDQLQSHLVDLLGSEIGGGVVLEREAVVLGAVREAPNTGIVLRAYAQLLQLRDLAPVCRQHLFLHRPLDPGHEILLRDQVEFRIGDLALERLHEDGVGRLSRCELLQLLHRSGDAEVGWDHALLSLRPDLCRLLVHHLCERFDTRKVVFGVLHRPHRMLRVEKIRYHGVSTGELRHQVGIRRVESVPAITEFLACRDAVDIRRDHDLGDGIVGRERSAVDVREFSTRFAQDPDLARHACGRSIR